MSRSFDSPSDYLQDEYRKETALPENPKALRAAADDKAPLDYLEPLVNPPLARVMKHGADKYGYRNYVDTPMKVRTYIGSTRRHLDAIALGEDIDPDSGESHWAHIIAGAVCYFAAEINGNAVDDRKAFSTPLSDRVHIDGDRDAKGLTPEYNRGIDELAEEMQAAARLNRPLAQPRRDAMTDCNEWDANGVCIGWER